MTTHYYLVVDIETLPMDVPYGIVPEPTAPSHYRDPVKIAEAIEARRADQRARMALDPWTSRPIVIGWLTEAEGPRVVACRTDEDLIEALGALWTARRYDDGHLGAMRPIVGFRIRTFDLPHLLYHSRRLGMYAPALDLRRWGSRDVLDLYDLLCDDGTEHVASRSLRSTCRAYGLDGQYVAEDAVMGGDVAAAVRDGRLDDVLEHCRMDLIRTLRLAEVVGVIADV